ncbi:DUF943 family protein [Rahnella perminowiae]|uniref:DUF943 family protein n=1 Tax=Rahnella perminowiae TaxID=2816244 RepID=UPI00365F60EA
MKNIIPYIAIFGIVIFSFFYFFRSPEVIFVHNEKQVSVIVVKKFPLTQRGKLSWWKDNQKFLKDKYGIPARDKNGVYYIAILDVNDGFKKFSEADYTSWHSFSRDDLICFDEIKSESRCIEKNVLMEITAGTNGKIGYIFDGEYIN